MKKLLFILCALSVGPSAQSQSPWWTSSDSVHVFSRNTGSVLIGSYEPLGKLTLGTDALNTSLALVGDYNNFAKNYLKIGVFGRSTDKIQGQAFFDLYHSNSNPKNVGYNFRVNNKSLFYINAEGNVGIGTDKPQAGLDIASASSWGSFKKGIRLAPDNALAIDAGTIKYGIVGNENNLHFFSTNSDEKLSPFGNAFNKLVTFQPQKVVIEGDLEVKGRIIYQGEVGVGSGGGMGGETPGGEDGKDDGDRSGGGGISPIQAYTPSGDADGDSLWENGGSDIYTIWRASTGNVGIGTAAPGSKLTITPIGSSSSTSSLNVVGASSLFFVRDDGNIGINQSLPAYKLDVNGTMRVASAATFSSTSTFSGAATFSNAANFAGSGVWNTSGNVGIGTTSPSGKLSVFEGGSSATKTLFTQGLTKSGVNVQTTLTSTAYTPGIFWSTTNDNSTKPKAGVFLYTTATGSYMYFGTSNAFATGITNDAIVIDPSGNVGIGQTTPSYKLHVNGTTGFGNTVNFPGTGIWNASGNVGIGVASPTAKVEIANGPSWTEDDYKRTMKLLSTSCIEFDGGASTKYGLTAKSNGQLIIFSTPDEGTNGATNARMVINSNGNIGIGMLNPTELLSVNGNIRTKKVIVTQQSWSDFVFREGYRLRPLSEVAEFIKTHRHLPDIPSEKNVTDQGVDVGDMQAKLLQKIEELTLYVIELDSEIKNKDRMIRTLEEKIQQCVRIKP